MSININYPPTQSSASDYKIALNSGRWVLNITVTVSSLVRSNGTVMVTAPIRIGSCNHDWYEAAAWYLKDNDKSQQVRIYTSIKVDKPCIFSIKIQVVSGNPTIEVHARAVRMIKLKKKCNCDINLIMTQGCKCGGV